MANHKKAMLHHGKAGDALKKGDHKGAAHHMGHALAALRQAASDGDGVEREIPDGGSAAAPVKPSGLRSRLSMFKK